VSRSPAEDANNIGVEFLLTDLEIAMTFLDVAEVSRIPETVRRNHQNARDAYDSVLRLLHYVTPDARQQRVIDDKLRTLKARLEAVGQQF
jgi:hypothetical protein